MKPQVVHLLLAVLVKVKHWLQLGNKGEEKPRNLLHYVRNASAEQQLGKPFLKVFGLLFGYNMAVVFDNCLCLLGQGVIPRTKIAKPTEHCIPFCFKVGGLFSVNNRLDQRRTVTQIVAAAERVNKASR